VKEEMSIEEMHRRFKAMMESPQKILEECSRTQPGLTLLNPSNKLKDSAHLQVSTLWQIAFM
jgi:hypothetical protein